MTTISTELQIALYRVRARVISIHANTDSILEDQKPLFVNLGKRFPTTKKGESRRKIRLNILSALVGHGLLSQSDLSKEEIRILVEATNDPSPYLTAKLASELETAAASAPDGLAWLLPTTAPDSLAVPSLR